MIQVACTAYDDPYDEYLNKRISIGCGGFVLPVARGRACYAGLALGT